VLSQLGFSTSVLKIEVSNLLVLPNNKRSFFPRLVFTSLLVDIVGSILPYGENSLHLHEIPRSDTFMTLKPEKRMPPLPT
jgi:threonine/homoserine efflux transporter RhtA